MKAILKPTLVKIILAVVLFVFFSWLWRTIVPMYISDTFPYGVPIPFYEAWGPCPPGENCSEFNTIWLFVDIAFWYLVTGFLMTRRQKEK